MRSRCRRGISRSPTPTPCSTCSRKPRPSARIASTRKLPIPAYEQAIKASHVFNTLQARGVISVAERQAYIGRVRDLAKAACAAWLEADGGGSDGGFPARTAVARKSRRGCRPRRATIWRGCSPRRWTRAGLGHEAIERLVDAAAAGADRARTAADDRGRSARSSKGPRVRRRRRRSRASCARPAWRRSSSRSATACGSR